MIILFEIELFSFLDVVMLNLMFQTKGIWADMVYCSSDAGAKLFRKYYFNQLL